MMARFSDVTRSSGVDFHYISDGFEGGGLAVADLDGDGLPDIVAGGRSGGLTLFWNRGALRFEQATDAGIDPTTSAGALAAADLDNDGDIDLVVASPTGVVIVLANHGAGVFVEIARLHDVGTTEHVLPVDIDGDGLLDLYFSNRDVANPANTSNRLYMNRSGLQFDFVGTVGTGLSWAATAWDFDNDGDQDLYVANDTLLADFGRPDAMSPSTSLQVDSLFRNDGLGADGIPRFTDMAASLGLVEPRSSMGGVLGDFDGDGRIDLFVPNYGAKKLFLDHGVGRYVESAAQFGLVAASRHNDQCQPDSASRSCLLMSWSAALSDFDLDGYDELLVVNGETSPPLDPPPVLVFAGGPKIPYREVAPTIGCMDARGLVVTDLDGDGDQDVVIAPRDGPLLIYKNDGTPMPRTWLRVTLRGKASNRQGVGAVVTLHMASGRAQTRVVGAGGVIHTASPQEAFFGLGTDGVLAVDVKWPSGQVTELLRPPTGTSIVIDQNP